MVLLYNRIAPMSIKYFAVNEKEALALLSALEDYLAKYPQCREAQELLSRIYECLIKQGIRKTKTNR
jgi:hypothetical protein